MEVTLLGIVTDVRAVQPIKASFPMEVTVYALPLYVTEDGIVTLPE